MIKNEENRQNPNRLIKFSEIWYLDAFRDKKIQQQKIISGFGIFGQKTAKMDQKWRKLAKSKPFNKIFWNLVVDTSQQK